MILGAIDFPRLHAARIRERNMRDVRIPDQSPGFQRALLLARLETAALELGAIEDVNGEWRIERRHPEPVMTMQCAFVHVELSLTDVHRLSADAHAVLQLFERLLWIEHDADRLRTCVLHRDCREHVSLGDACWLSSHPSGGDGSSSVGASSKA